MPDILPNPTSLSCTVCRGEGRETPAEWNVWPDVDGWTLYDYMCTEHMLAAIKTGMPRVAMTVADMVPTPVFQVTRIKTGEQWTRRHDAERQREADAKKQAAELDQLKGRWAWLEATLKERMGQCRESMERYADNKSQYGHTSHDFASGAWNELDILWSDVQRRKVDKE